MKAALLKNLKEKRAAKRRTSSSENEDTKRSIKKTKASRRQPGLDDVAMGKIKAKILELSERGKALH